MVDAGIGRLLIASLHQGIGEVVPMRLEFYENWLSPNGLRDGRMGLAPLGAVLSFVHREDPPDNVRIPEHAGRRAAEWTVADQSALGRRLMPRLPLWMRWRSALGLGRTLARDTSARSRVTARRRGSSAIVEIRSPIFEYLKETSATPMRCFYAAAFTEFLHACHLEGVVTVEPGPDCCRLAISLTET